MIDLTGGLDLSSILGVEVPDPLGVLLLDRSDLDLRLGRSVIAGGVSATSAIACGVRVGVLVPSRNSVIGAIGVTCWNDPSVVTTPPLVFIPDDDELLSAAAIACEPPNESPESPVVDMVLLARRASLRLITCEQV